MRLKFRRERPPRPETYAQAEALDDEVDGDEPRAGAGKTVDRDPATGRFVKIAPKRT
jgi:hypothetical protein